MFHWKFWYFIKLSKKRVFRKSQIAQPWDNMGTLFRVVHPFRIESPIELSYSEMYCQSLDHHNWDFLCTVLRVEKSVYLLLGTTNQSDTHRTEYQKDNISFEFDKRFSPNRLVTNLFLFM